MARSPRLFASGLLYHVIVRGNQRRKTFRSAADYQAYLDRLEKYRVRYRLRIYAYCLMPNHVHLLVETGSTPLAKFMQGLQQSYTQYFNWRYGKVGHLFQGRYKAIICERDQYLLALVRYIHLNPVRAKLTTRPERYPYSGHKSYLAPGKANIVESAPILKLLGGNKAYERFVLEGIGEKHNEEYYTVQDQRFLGEDGFGEEISRGIEGSDERKKSQPIEITIKKIARQLESTPELLKSRDRRWEISAKRAELVVRLVREHGYTVSEVAKQLGRDQAHISTMLSRWSASQGRQR